MPLPAEAPIVGALNPVLSFMQGRGQQQAANAAAVIAAQGRQQAQSNLDRTAAQQATNEQDTNTRAANTLQASQSNADRTFNDADAKQAAAIKTGMDKEYEDARLLPQDQQAAKIGQINSDFHAMKLDAHGYQPYAVPGAVNGSKSVPDPNAMGPFGPGPKAGTPPTPPPAGYGGTGPTQPTIQQATTNPYLTPNLTDAQKLQDDKTANNSKIAADLKAIQEKQQSGGYSPQAYIDAVTNHNRVFGDTAPVPRAANFGYNADQYSRLQTAIANKEPSFGGYDIKSFTGDNAYVGVPPVSPLASANIAKDNSSIDASKAKITNDAEATTEKNRHDLAQEQIDTAKNLTESQKAAATLAETTRHNKATETLGQGNLDYKNNNPPAEKGVNYSAQIDNNNNLIQKYDHQKSVILNSLAAGTKLTPTQASLIAGWNYNIKALQDQNTALQGNQKTGAPMPVGNVNGLSTDPRHGGNYRDIIASTSAKYGVDPRAIQAIINRESGGNPNSKNLANRNGTGDYGIMQVNSATKDPNSYNWKDPAANIDAGVAEFKNKLNQAGGDYLEAFHRYNGLGAPVTTYGKPVYDDYMKLKGQSGSSNAAVAQGAPKSSSARNTLARLGIK